MDALAWPFSDQVFREVVTAATVVIVVALVARIATLFLDRVVLRLAGRTRTPFDDRIISAVRTPVFVLIVLLGVRAGLAQLTFLSETWIHTLEGLLFIGFVFVGCVLLYRLVAEIVAWFTKNLTVDDGIDTQLVTFVRRVVQLVLVSIAVIMVLDHFGLDISALVATLGVSSLAVALAARAFLEDMIAGVLIIIDRPFGVGDRIELPHEVMGEYGDWGDVVEIGVRSTRIRSVDGVILTVPNSKLTNEVVIREIEEYDVLLELRFYVDDARQMRRAKSVVTESILEAFEEKGIRLATPTQVVQLISQQDVRS